MKKKERFRGGMHKLNRCKCGCGTPIKNKYEYTVGHHNYSRTMKRKRNGHITIDYLINILGLKIVTIEFKKQRTLDE